MTLLPLSNGQPAFIAMSSVFQVSHSPHEYELTWISHHSNSINSVHSTGQQLIILFFNLQVGIILKVKSFLATEYQLYLIDMQFIQLGF